MSQPIVSRSQAIENGSATYFTGLPCSAGHVAERKVSGWHCIACSREKYLSGLTSGQKKRAENKANASRRVISRDEAAALGLKRFFTGLKCVNGHLSERHVNGGGCIKCKEKTAVEWRKKNPERYSAAMSGYATKRRRHDTDFAMRIRVRAVVANAFARMGYKKSSRTEAIIGCSWPELMLHLERQFLPGMNWDNRDRWHIDHIIPISSAETEHEALALNHFTNLRPLWGVDNIRKSNRSEFLI